MGSGNASSIHRSKNGDMAVRLGASSASAVFTINIFSMDSAAYRCRARIAKINSRHRRRCRTSLKDKLELVLK